MSRLFRLGMLASFLLIAAACTGQPEPEPSPSADVGESAIPAYSPSPLPTPSRTSVVSSPSPRPITAVPVVPSPDPAPPAPAPPVPATSATGPAPAGSYAFAQSGRVSSAGCLLFDQAVPDTVLVTADPANGNRQRIVRETQGDPSVRSILDLTLEYREDGAYLVSLRQLQTVALQTLEFNFPAEPPKLLIPARPQVGQQVGFPLTTADGHVSANLTSTVEALDEPVTLERGAVMPAHRIRTVTTVTGTSPQGSLDLTITRVTWYSPVLHLEIKDSTGIQGTVGLCQVDSQTESLARSF